MNIRKIIRCSKKPVRVLTSLFLITFIIFASLYICETGDIEKEIYEIDEEYYGYVVAYHDYVQIQPHEPSIDGIVLMDYDTADKYASETLKNIN